MRPSVLHGLEIQRECGFKCDYIRILLAKARSPSLSFGDYARNHHKKKDRRVATERSERLHGFWNENLLANARNLQRKDPRVATERRERLLGFWNENLLANARSPKKQRECECEKTALERMMIYNYTHSATTLGTFIKRKDSRVVRLGLTHGSVRKTV